MPKRHWEMQWPLMNRAVQNCEAQRLERAAHRLKGTLGSIGATTAHSLAYALETLGREGSLDGAAALVPKLEHELEHISAFFAGPAWQDEGKGHAYPLDLSL